MKNHIAYLSEWGNNVLEFSKITQSGQWATTHFIVAAIITGSDTRSQLPILEAVKNRHSKGEI